MEDISKFCMLCEPTGNNSFGETVCVTRGLDKIIQTSISRGGNVKELLTNRSSVIVHVKCRKDYTRRLGLAPKKLIHYMNIGKSLISNLNVYFLQRKFMRMCGNLGSKLLMSTVSWKH